MTVDVQSERAYKGNVLQRFFYWLKWILKGMPNVAVQHEGKWITAIRLKDSMTPEQVSARIESSKKILDLIGYRPIQTVVYIPGKLVNILTRDRSVAPPPLPFASAFSTTED